MGALAFGKANDCVALVMQGELAELDKLDLSTSGGIPVDANCLVLYSPTRDLTPHEASLITAYLNQGGSLMLNTSPEAVESCPNLNSVVSIFFSCFNLNYCTRTSFDNCYWNN